MRTTLQIILAVKESQNVTEEELKLALVALEGISYFYHHTAQDLVEAIEGKKSQVYLDLKAGFARKSFESMFKALKTAPDKWLGPANTPGTEEYKQRMGWAKSLFKKATGIDL